MKTAAREPSHCRTRLTSALSPSCIKALLYKLRSAPLPARNLSLTRDEMNVVDDLASAPRRGQKILLVDDRKENLHALTLILEDVDATLILARSGDEALRASLHHEFALAILDVKMPNMDGYELAEILRGDDKTRHLPIIFLSAALLSEHDVFKGYESGAVDYLTKPFNPRILLSKVQVFLQLDRQRDELSKQAMVYAANKELEAFSYSVSHDLRAPLRLIKGFAGILLEEHHNHLDSQGQRYLEVIASQVDKMDTLIEDLLEFSRMGRRPLESSEIAMDRLAGDVFKEVALAAGDRELQFHMDHLPPAHGDRAMIRQVLANLLSNAVKFTRARTPAVIEVGHEPGDSRANETLYYIKDNGVGFNMKHRNKLFEVFQRLHSTDEFDGSGIGLALVRRIVERHGGEVWAEGRVDAGATFYFSLPARR